jgi:hypothetical protein
VKSRVDKEMGRYAFLAGLLLSVVLGLTEVAAGLAWLVALLAVAVAVLNIQAKETMKLLLWTIGMGVIGVGAMAANFAGIPAIGETLAAVITNIGVFFMTVSAVFLLKIGYKMFER